MFKLIGKALYQWDLDRQIEVTDASITEVHYAHEEDAEAIVVEVAEVEGVRVASIPNTLLQSEVKIRFWLCDGNTKHGDVLNVTPRTKPSDYVYTETEVKRYETLEARIEVLEQNGGGGSVDLSGIEADIEKLQGDVGKLSEDIANLEIPTDEHINALISDALGVVENGSY